MAVNSPMKVKRLNSAGVKSLEFADIRFNVNYMSVKVLRQFQIWKHSTKP